MKASLTSIEGMRYVFVRAATGAEVQPDEVRVLGGLVEFLRKAAPWVEPRLVEARLEELEKEFGDGKPLPPRWQRWMEAMGDEEAREMLADLCSMQGRSGEISSDWPCWRDLRVLGMV